VVAAGFVLASYHYPAFDPIADGMPACELAERDMQRERYAEGAIPLISGTLSATFFFDKTQGPDAGYLETFSRAVILELGEQYYGLAIKSMTATLASAVTPGQRAAEENTPGAEYRTVTITAQYGLSR
jgi:hypothetical protein